MRTVLLFLLSITAPSLATASAVPSPSNSTVDPCILVCPMGDMVFQVVVRDLANNPIAGSTVVVDYCLCPGSLILCPLPGGGPLTVAGTCTLTRVSDSQGIVRFAIRAGGGGVCTFGNIDIRADGVLLAMRGTVASPDQSGDGVVNVVDQGALAAKIADPGYDPSADLDCDGDDDAADSTVLAQHLDHACGMVTPVRARTWGGLKITYR